MKTYEQVIEFLFNQYPIYQSKGLDAYKKLDKYLNDNKLPFVFFSSAIDSWPEAHTASRNILNK